ncbi:MAG TPA: hypothetical protein DDW87_14140 [Firmicutes bacterium]|nr:hypothetical protein [Bacillota bacterium]
MDHELSQIDLLVAVLVRFPQIGTIHYEPDAKTLRLVFLIKDAQEDFPRFAKKFEAHLALFHHLRKESVSTASLEKKGNSELTVLEVVRDLATMSLGELDLIVRLVSDYYGDTLAQEGSDVGAEDQAEQDFTIETLLMSTTWRSLERLTGFRENGRVLVFSVPVGVRHS